MNILHIITGLNDGGAEAVLFRLCTHDQYNQHAVLSLMDEGKYGPLLRETGVTVHCLGMPRGMVNLSGLFKGWRLIRRLRPDVVQTWMYHADLLGGLVARLAGCRNVVWGIRHSNLEPGKSRSSTILVAKACARLSKWIPSRIVVCADKAVQVHADLGYATDKMTVIPNGYNLVRFRPDSDAGESLREAWGIAVQKPLIGMVARFDPQKDHGNLLAALGLLKERGVEYRCVFVGTGVDGANKTLTQLITAADLKENVQLLGRHNDIPAVMNALDLHVLSSSFGEAFPNVLAEAMACGTPCVTTDVGDAAFIVSDTGWIVPAKNPRLLANALESAIEERKDQLSWQRRQRAARKRIEMNFDLGTMIKSYHKQWFG
jgi:glycosyltransferase involved in cell wall biosynthesis